MMFIWVIIIGVILYVYFEKGTFKFERNSNPINLLDERLAKGEVGLEEYKMRKKEMRDL